LGESSQRVLFVHLPDGLVLKWSVLAARGPATRPIFLRKCRMIQGWSRLCVHCCTGTGCTQKPPVIPFMLWYIPETMLGPYVSILLICRP
jgi:hypothetical protein